jgi:hypothetical protein
MVLLLRENEMDLLLVFLYGWALMAMFFVRKVKAL